MLLAFWLAVIPSPNWLFNLSQSKVSTARAKVLWSVTTHDKLCASVWVPADVDFVRFFRQNCRISRIVLGGNGTGELSTIHNDGENKQIKRGTDWLTNKSSKRTLHFLAVFFAIIVRVTSSNPLLRCRCINSDRWDFIFVGNTHTGHTEDQLFCEWEVTGRWSLIKNIVILREKFFLISPSQTVKGATWRPQRQEIH